MLTISTHFQLIRQVPYFNNSPACQNIFRDTIYIQPLHRGQRCLSKFLKHLVHKHQWHCRWNLFDFCLTKQYASFSIVQMTKVLWHGPFWIQSFLARIIHLKQQKRGKISSTNNRERFTLLARKIISLWKLRI